MSSDCDKCLEYNVEHKTCDAPVDAWENMTYDEIQLELGKTIVNIFQTEYGITRNVTNAKHENIIDKE